MLDQLIVQANEAMVSIGAGLVALGAAAASYYLKLYAEKIKADTKRIKDQNQAQLMWQAIDRLEDITEKVVAKTEQTVAESLRQAVKDGTADRSELLKLGKWAQEEVLQTLEPEVYQMLQDNLGDLRAYVESAVETQVKRLKDAKMQ